MKSLLKDRKRAILSLFGLYVHLEGKSGGGAVEKAR